MKLTFWKNKGTYNISIFCFIIFILSIVVFGIASIFNKAFWPAIVLFSFLLILCLIELIFSKNLLAKIIFTDEEIEVKKFKKTLNKFRWEDIKEVKTKYLSVYEKYLCFVTEKEEIKIEITGHLYGAIMYMCPCQNIKNEIKKLECFKCYHIYDITQNKK